MNQQGILAAAIVSCFPYCSVPLQHISSDSEAPTAELSDPSEPLSRHLGPVSWRQTTVKWRQSSQSNRHSTIGTQQTSTMQRYHQRRTTRWDVTARSLTMITLHDTRFVKCQWWNDGWTVKTVVTWQSSASMVLAPGQLTRWWGRNSMEPWQTYALLWIYGIQSIKFEERILLTALREKVFKDSGWFYF